MVNDKHEVSYEIYDETSVRKAATILRDASPELGIILILGNQIDPVDIPDLYDYQARIQSNANEQLSQPEIDRRYFTHLELQRSRTSNFLPHQNYLCLLRLVRKKIVKSIITTNYDRYIFSTFLRYGQPYKCVLNPCLLKKEGENAEWDCDGYYSSANWSDKEIPLWKIHGDLGFVRMDECQHIFSLPKFRIDRIARDELLQLSCCHCIILKGDGNHYNDPYLTRKHPATWYRHNIDLGTDRRVFRRESEAAQKQLLQHCQNGGALFIIGLSFSPEFKEELKPIVSMIPKSTPLVYIIASKKRIQASDSELLSELQEMKRDFILVNEINEDRLIDNALVEITVRSGEQDINSEYERWKTGGKWWLKF